MPATDRPPRPTQHRAAVARVEADLAAAQLRRGRLERDSAFAAPSDAAELGAKLAEADATIAELEAQREDLVAPSAEAAPEAPPAPTAAPADAPAFLDTREAAAVLGVSGKTLESLRARGAGPPFKKVGRRVRYERALLLEWARQK